ncbi:GNAT family N-acetyltransferase [Pseudonocardia kunmingensis]|uniref:GNAT family N-acetyltransferase n=1 Tax=Pseudonocardia kunmingensis TaxID=630975 RepID=UPI00319E48EF
MRCDDRVDDRQAVLESSSDPEILRWRHRPPAEPAEAEAYIRRRAGGWTRDERCTWAVCEPTTGEMLGEVELAQLDLCHGTADVTCWALPAARGRGMTSTALAAVLRFAFGGLDLHRVTYAWADGNVASGRVAEKCGFVLEGRQRAAWVVDGRRVDVHVAGRLATDA